MSNFLIRLKQLRKTHGITQVQLATALGISKGSVAMWETDQRKPDFDGLISLSDYFGISIDDLIGRNLIDSEAKGKTNFEMWKESLTPEFIANAQFLVLSCGACPASGKTCNRYDTTWRGNFLNWARAKHENGEVTEECEN